MTKAAVIVVPNWPSVKNLRRGTLESAKGQRSSRNVQTSWTRFTKFWAATPRKLKTVLVSVSELNTPLSKLSISPSSFCRASRILGWSDICRSDDIWTCHKWPMWMCIESLWVTCSNWTRYWWLYTRLDTASRADMYARCCCKAWWILNIQKTALRHEIDRRKKYSPFLILPRSLQHNPLHEKGKKILWSSYFMSAGTTRFIGNIHHLVDFPARVTGWIWLSRLKWGYTFHWHPDEEFEE